MPADGPSSVPSLEAPDTAPAIACHGCGQHLGRWNGTRGQRRSLPERPTPAKRVTDSRHEGTRFHAESSRRPPPEEGLDDLLPWTSSPVRHDGEVGRFGEAAVARPCEKEGQGRNNCDIRPVIPHGTAACCPPSCSRNCSFIRPPDDDRELRLNESLELPAERVAELPKEPRRNYLRRVLRLSRGDRLVSSSCPPGIAQRQLRSIGATTVSVVAQDTAEPSQPRSANIRTAGGVNHRELDAQFLPPGLFLKLLRGSASQIDTDELAVVANEHGLFGKRRMRPHIFSSACEAVGLDEMRTSQLLVSRRTQPSD